MDIDKHFSRLNVAGYKKVIQMPTLCFSQAYKGGLAFKHLQVFTTASDIKGEKLYGHPNRCEEKSWYN